MLKARPSRLLRGSGGWLVSKRGAAGISFPPLVGRLVPLSPAGVLLLFFLCCVFAVFLCFDNLRVLLARVVWLFMWFSFCFFFALCKTLVVDPGVRGALVGFPVHPWSCVLLVLRLALSVRFVFVALRCAVLFLSSLLAKCLLG